MLLADSATYSNVNANQYSALLSSTFNLDCGNLQSFPLLKLLHNGDTAGSRNEFSQRFYADGVVLPDLVSRRKAERELLLIRWLGQQPVFMYSSCYVYVTERCLCLRFTLMTLDLYVRLTLLKA